MFSSHIRIIAWLVLMTLGTAVGLGDFAPGSTGENDEGSRRSRERAEPVDRSRIAPLPQDVETSVRRGGQVVITLSSRGKYGELVEYTLREEPQHGTLSEMRRVDLNQVEVTYTHSGEMMVKEDQFFYAAQSRGTQLSGRATVTIEIEESPGILEVPAKLDFGEVIAGERAEQDLVLTNSGDGEMMTDLRLPLSFELGDLDPAGVVILPNQERPVRLVFAPERPGEIRDPIVYGGAPGLFTMLVARAVPPLRVESPGAEGKLLLERGESEIAGEILVTNRSQSTRSVAAKTLRPLMVTPSIVIAPGETGVIAVSAPGSHPEGLEGKVEITGDFLEETVEVKLLALPARLVGPERVEVREEDTAGAWVRLKNEGGEVLRDFRPEYSPPFFISQGPEFPTNLGPGEEVTLRLGHNGNARGHDDLQLKLMSGETLLHEVEIAVLPSLVTQTPSAETANPVTPSSSRAGASSTAISVESSVRTSPVAATQTVPRRQIGSDLLWSLVQEIPVVPMAHDFQVIERGKKHARVEFQSRLKEMGRVNVEQRLIFPGNGDEQPRVTWERWPNAEIQEEGGSPVLVLTQLPKHAVSFRIIADDQVISVPFQVPGAPPSAGLAIFWWLVLVIAIAAAAWFIWRWQLGRETGA